MYRRARRLVFVAAALIAVAATGIAPLAGASPSGTTTPATVIGSGGYSSGVQFNSPCTFANGTVSYKYNGTHDWQYAFHMSIDINHAKTSGTYRFGTRWAGTVTAHLYLSNGQVKTVAWDIPLTLSIWTSAAHTFKTTGISWVAMSATWNFQVYAEPTVIHCAGTSSEGPKAST